MTIFEEYMNKSIKCTEICKTYMGKDTNLAMFYNNASIGFKEKALKLKLNDSYKVSI